MKKIVLLGPPGSGKGTQAELLSLKENFVHLATGDLLRNEISNRTEFGKEIKNYIDKGLLVPDNLIVDFILDYIKKNDLYRKNVVFDGFPRRNFQAEKLEEELSKNESGIDYAILIDVDEQTIIERLSNRLVCSGCKKIYPGTYDDDECIVCHNKLIKRTDDNIDVIKNRIKVYKEETMELLDYYTKKGKLIRIDGKRKPEEIFEKIKEVVL
ncbi:MAG: adenylate kinase [candidate division WOR-3 bacterium]